MAEQDVADPVELTDEQVTLLGRLGGITVALVDDGDGPPRLEFDGELVFDLHDPAQRELAERLSEMQVGDRVTFALRLPAGSVVKDDRGRIERRARVQGFTLPKRVGFAVLRATPTRVRPRARGHRSPRRSVRRASCRARSPGRKPSDPEPPPLTAPRRGERQQ